MINEEGYRNSLDLLKRASTPYGFVAALQETDNYRRIWSRDGMICGIAGLLSGDIALWPVLESGIQLMFDNQHATGFIPSNVIPGSLKASYGGAVGRADNASWAVIGLLKWSAYTNTDRLLVKYRDQVRKCFQLLDAWEYNGRGLLYVPQSGDWADEYIHHGYILYDQLLRVWALELAADAYNEPTWRLKAAEIRSLIANDFWKHSDHKIYYTPTLARQMADAPDGRWLMGFNPSGIYHQYDLGANALAILLGIGDNAQQSAAVAWLESLVTDDDNILPSFSPVIMNEDVSMLQLKNNYAYTFRNHPHEFHNGGLWPVWNGFAVAALSRGKAMQAANKLTGNIHKANVKGGVDGAWGFFENIHGLTGMPIGIKECTWSAAGAVIAEQALNGNYII